MGNLGVKSVFMQGASGFLRPRVDHVEDQSQRKAKRRIRISDYYPIYMPPEQNGSERDDSDCQSRIAVGYECTKGTEEEAENGNLHEYGEELERTGYRPSFKALCIQFSSSGFLLGVMECFPITRVAR